MTKRSTRIRRKAQLPQRRTNWVIIGGIGIGGLLILIGLFALAWGQPQTGFPDLVDYCDQNPGHCISTGPVQAAVTLIEVSDYGCSHCRDFNLLTAPILKEEFVEPGRIRWITLPFALFPQTTQAAEAAMCAAEQDAFEGFHQRMFEIQDTPNALTRDGFVEAAGNLGLDIEAFTTCLTSGRYRAILEANNRAATQAGVKATPSFFINGTLLEGNYPLDTFRQRLNAQLN
jgi:protein-disulfide isomerase